MFLKLNRTATLLLAGLAVYCLASYLFSGMTTMLGEFAIVGLVITRRLLWYVNLALGVLLAAASVFAGRLKRASIVPAAACALEFLLILAAGIVPGAFVSMMHVPLETTDVVVRCLRMTDLGMLIGMVLAIAAGMLAAKRRLLLPVLVIAGAAVLSAAGFYVMTFWLGLGISGGMVAVGFLQPFAFLFPAFAFDGTPCALDAEKPAAASTVTPDAAPAAKPDAVPEEKPEETGAYSYLEAYKNKRR